jgi:concanavalin A-like lectin/glucanase superfamily protein
MKKSILVLLAGLQTLVIGGGVKYSRDEYVDRLEVKPRKSMTSRTYVFPRSQLKYGHYQNYLNWWVDRPLNMDRSLRYPTGVFKHIIKEDFLNNTVPIVKKYGVDGLANISSPSGHCRMYGLTAGWLKDAKVTGFIQLPEYAGGGGLNEKTYQYYDKTIKIALGSPNSFKINGKVVISNYVAIWWKKPANLKKLLDKLRKDNGDTFYFVADMGAIVNRFVRDKMVRRGLKANQPPKAELEKLKADFRSWLDVSDGLLFAGTGHMSSHSASYADKFAESYYRDLAIPILLQVIKAPKYRDKKIIGLSAVLGYTNFLSGVNHSEMNTRRLRQTFEAAMNAKPDFINLPEWNEVNENTSIQPTVSNGWTTQRIIKRLMHFIKNEKPTPNKGDNLNIPNMAISYRKTLKYGEVLEVELLNIPDSDSNETYTAKLILKNLNAEVLEQFPTEKFTVKQMKDVTFNIPTTQFPQAAVLRPELKIVSVKGKKYTFSNLHYVRLHPTISWDYQSVKQCLRDQITPESVQLNVTADNGKVKITGAIKTNEKLASVEILEDEREVFGIDRANEFDPNRDLIIYLEGSASKNTYLTGKITVAGASNVYARPIEHANSDFLGLKVKGNVLNINQRLNTLHRSFLLRIPRKDATKTILKCSLNGKNFDIPVTRLMNKGAFGMALNKNQGFVKISQLNKQPDIPVRLNGNTAKFAFTTIPTYKYPVYSMRAIGVSGRIYRSKPFMPIKPEATPAETINVWNEFTNKPVAIKIAESRIPDITFSYTPDNGDVLKCKWSRFWSAEMGGGTKYGDSFNRSSNYPKDVKVSAPRKVKDENGKYCLEFDGKGTYVVIPREAFPRGAFTLSFDIKSRSREPQVIFRHHGIYIGSLTLILRDGKLWANFTDKSLKDHAFETGLPVPLNKWSKVSIMYDYHRIIFSVDGNIRSYPFSKRALFFKPCVIGGHTRPGFGMRKNTGIKFFNGLIRDFRVYHNVKKNIFNSYLQQEKKSMNKKARILAAAAVLSASAVFAADSSVTFYAPYNKSVNPEFAKGRKTPNYAKNANLVDNKKFGKVLKAAGAGYSLIYSVDKNIPQEQGTIEFSYKPMLAPTPAKGKLIINRLFKAYINKRPEFAKGLEIGINQRQKTDYFWVYMNNETKKPQGIYRAIKFKNGQWYKIQVSWKPGKIALFLDGKLLKVKDFKGKMELGELFFVGRSIHSGVANGLIANFKVTNKTIVPGPVATVKKN